MKWLCWDYTHIFLEAAGRKRLNLLEGFLIKQPVYVNVSLSRAKDVLLGKARAACKEGKLATVWVDCIDHLKIKKFLDVTYACTVGGRFK